MLANVAQNFHLQEDDLLKDEIWCQSYALCNSPGVVADVWNINTDFSYHICYIRLFFCKFSISNGYVK